ncbi:MAG: hypothetical protein HUU46_07395 [Candidatus Hydrogenedentes bacterium]|nr:hypothetical protein [Candidatus Hydrogenedentota bacterium]
MSEKFFFVPLLMNALAQQDAAVALREAFRTVVSLGRNPKYREGFVRFQEFMALVQAMAKERKERPSGAQDHREKIGLLSVHVQMDEAHELALSLAAQFDVAEIDALLREQEFVIEPGLDKVDICIQRNDGPLEPVVFGAGTDRSTVSRINPGHYRLVLSTGRVLWEGDLSKSDVLLAYAFPAVPMRLAADTGEDAERTTRRFSILGGEVSVSLYPGRQAGRMEFRLCEPGA